MEAEKKRKKRGIREGKMERGAGGTTEIEVGRRRKRRKKEWYKQREWG